MSDDDLKNTLDDLDFAFDNLEIKPVSKTDLGRVVGGNTSALNCTSAATCNSKCGHTEYWECEGTNTCDEVACYTTCLAWGPTCSECPGCV
jgi:hypothetical protein